MVDYLNSIGINNAMITSGFITIFIAVVCIIVSRNMKMIPSGLQNVVEMGIEKNYNFFKGVMGDHMVKRYYPIVGTLFIYILVCNYSGLIPFAGELPGFQAPTSNINFPAGMAITVFCMIQIIGLRERGFKTFKRFFKPFAVLFPLLLLDEFVKPVSLTFRLYGNIYGDEAVVNAFFDMVPFGLPVVFQMLGVLMGLIQALVFSLLTAIYIGEACEDHDHL